MALVGSASGRWSDPAAPNPAAADPAAPDPDGTGPAAARTDALIGPAADAADAGRSTRRRSSAPATVCCPGPLRPRPFG